MRKADFTARVKKIEIVNRVLSDGWAQSIRVVLEDIELTDENLLELKQFKPNEQVLVELSPSQVNLLDFDAKNQAAASTGPSNQELLGSDNMDVEEKEFMNFMEGDEPLTSAAIEAAMDLMIAKNIFTTSGGDLVSKYDAKLISTDTTDLYNPPA